MGSEDLTPSNLNSFLPTGVLPRLSSTPADQTVEWNDITYSFNNLGYRSVPFDTRADIRIVAIGCSYVMGIGLPQSHLFHELFAEKLRSETGKTVAVLNLGAVGRSNDYIARLLHLATPILKPGIVLINFTHPVRREYVSVQNELLTYVPSFRPSNRVLRDIYEHFAGLTSPLDDDLNLFRNYKSVEALLGDSAWLFSSINATDFVRIRAHISLSRYVGAMPQLDKGRDGSHPGPESHKALMERYWERFVASGWSI